jgi:hypothetical protein
MSPLFIGEECNGRSEEVLSPSESPRLRFIGGDTTPRFFQPERLKSRCHGVRLMILFSRV